VRSALDYFGFSKTYFSEGPKGGENLGLTSRDLRVLYRNILANWRRK